MSHPDPAPTPADGTFRHESASPATRAPARPTTPRGQARTIRSQINRAVHASKQAARDLRRAARRLPEDNPHRVQLLAMAEREEATAETWEAMRPPVPPRKRR